MPEAPRRELGRRPTADIELAALALFAVLCSAPIAMTLLAIPLALRSVLSGQ
ncbi:MAG TPA: hypothetical protein VJP77_00715 [Planctomycetota bacterium]|nr:hypothetical protein [Planctomycetota bacterium]